MLPKGSRGRPESPLDSLPQINYVKQDKYAAEGVKKESDEVCDRKAPDIVTLQAKSEMVHCE